MRSSIQKNPIASCRRKSEHPGLLLQRYLATDVSKTGVPVERRALFDATIQAVRSDQLRAIYKNAFDRWESSFSDIGGVVRADNFRTARRLIVGLGSESVLEVGIRLHHTYGLPLIPGTALKGLASHYCDHCWGQRGEGNPPQENRLFRRGEAAGYHDLLFGTTNDGGVIAFHDAWITPESLREDGLMLDVMTPHHPKWQVEGGVPPTDFDSPNPVVFLSVSGDFRIRVSWSGPRDCDNAPAWTDLAFRLLKESLADWGVGGKTSSGYGRLTQNEVGSHAAPPATRTGARSKKQQHSPGKRIIVTRVEDPKKKGRAWFVGDDGCGGVIASGEKPDVEVGQTFELEVASHNGYDGYNFRLPQREQQRPGANPQRKHPRK